MDEPVSLREYLEQRISCLEQRFDDEKGHVAERSKLLAENLQKSSGSTVAWIAALISIAGFIVMIVLKFTGR